VVGVLDVSGDRRSFHKHTMALVRMSALMVENRMFAAAVENAISLHFHTRPEFIGTLMEEIASFSPGGRFLARQPERPVPARPVPRAAGSHVQLPVRPVRLRAVRPLPHGRPRPARPVHAQPRARPRGTAPDG
jgi:hypothetical protein